MKAVLGVDPGLSGALALYDQHRDLHMLEIIDMPTLQITTNGKKRRQIDLYALANWMDLHSSQIGKAVIEQVGAMPGQGVSSCFKFGESFGIVKAMVAANVIPMDLVHPRTWKKHFGLTADKDASRLHASRLLPQFSHLWARAIDDGRAEAALLALYGSR